MCVRAACAKHQGTAIPPFATLRQSLLLLVQEYMARVTKERSSHVTSKEKYVRSLNQYLENMPEHCMQDLADLLPGQVVGLFSMLLLAATGYVALTSTVIAVKKDY